MHNPTHTHTHTHMCTKTQVINFVSFAPWSSQVWFEMRLAILLCTCSAVGYVTTVIHTMPAWWNINTNKTHQHGDGGNQYQHTVLDRFGCFFYIPTIRSVRFIFIVDMNMTPRMLLYDTKETKISITMIMILRLLKFCFCLLF